MFESVSSTHSFFLSLSTQTTLLLSDLLPWSAHTAPKSGLRGTLRLVTEEEAMEAFLADPPSYRVSLVMDPELFIG